MIRRMFSSEALKARKFLFVKKFDGEPIAANFDLVDDDLSALKDGEILTSAEFLSVDPYMRPYMSAYKPPCQMIGGQVAKVLESKNPSFPEGAKIFGQFGWRTHNVVNPTEIQKKKFIDCYQLPEFQGHPTSLGLGLLGMPGNTAHFGMKEILKPEDGETIVITGAAGAVGTIVGQLAKLKGCRVVGFAGSEEKCRWLENEYGFDKAINYKTPDLAKQLKDATPQRVDMYFDNVGGEISSLIYGRMNDYGRIAVCGAIDSYNHDKPNLHAVQKFFVAKQLKLEGFLVWRWSDRWLEGLNEMATLLKEGKLKYHETVTEGFENTPQAFIEMLRGKNYGKAIVKV